MLDNAGRPTAYNGNAAAQQALASIAYSVAKRQAREIQGFTANTNIDAHVNALEL